MTGSRLPITVAVPVKNEEAALGRCLSRLGRFAKVVVIDSASTDRTVEVAREHGAEVVDFAWNGAYPKKRNWFLLNSRIETPWVLFLDADELVDEAFCREVETAISTGEFSGFWLNYTNYFLGAPLRHGLPQRKLALFRVGAGLYERIDEQAWSRLDMEVHEHPIIEGRVGEIAAPIEHNDDRGISRFIERHRDYALWEARRVLALRREDPRLAQAHLTGRQKFKYRHMAAWWYPAFYFFYAYVCRLGVLDGRPGFFYAAMKLWYFTLIQLFIRELRQAEGASAAP